MNTTVWIILIIAGTVIALTAWKFIRVAKDIEKENKQRSARKRLQRGDECIVKYAGVEIKGRISYRADNGRVKIRIEPNTYIWRWINEVWPIP